MVLEILTLQEYKEMIMNLYILNIYTEASIKIRTMLRKSLNMK